MKKNLFIALSAMLLPFFAAAQFSLNGKITQNKTHEPLIGANVTLNGVLSSQTDGRGNYSFRNLKPGKYRVLITYVGYRSSEQSLTISDNTSWDIGLERANMLADEVIVRATRASENSATTYRNLTREEIQKNNLGQDLPFLLNQTPGVVITSDAGAGVGYTGIRIRGSDATRINMTINGIPYNDTESQGTYLVNLPDFASSIDNIQIQRGVGTSTNGAGAFGASINIQTTTRTDSAYAELNNSIGSFDTWKNTFRVGTGLINGKFSFDGRLSRIKSDGYIDNAFSNLKSYFLSGAYYGKNSLLRANVFSGTEKTYQAWNGVPENLLTSNRTYNGFTYDDQTDNYTQDHYQVLYSRNISEKLNFNTALHYTYGRGYYEEYKTNASLSNYGISPVVTGSTSIKKSDLIRRRWLDNDFYGLTYSLNYTPQTALNLTLGGAYNEYDGAHFGEVIWAQYASDSKIRHRYYDGNGFKTDFNVFGKAAYQLGELNLFADLQYRRTDYTISGTDKNRSELNQHDKLDFLNPKFGLSYQIKDRNTIYASFAMANKEPNRDDYVNSTPATRPRSENLKNVEAGYRTAAQNFTAGINGYGMFYRDQLILTGKVNDVGEYIRQNVPDSYRLGIELDGKWQINNQLSWGMSAALSRNKVKDFTEFIDDYDNGTQVINNFKNTDIAFSPAFVGSGELTYSPFAKADISLLSKYVSDQFLDNTSNNSRRLEAFFVNDIRLAYQTAFKNVKNIGLTLLVNNVLGEKYEANGYTFSYFSSGAFATENYYYPQATRNFLLGLSLKF
ncbi:MAG TPA: TonB-dependent receptor [Sphingobacteriaceae bacterium]|nr:TonB-dependent receptor [Sphingobacteriaceae bacterium]